MVLHIRLLDATSRCFLGSGPGEITIKSIQFQGTAPVFSFEFVPYHAAEPTRLELTFSGSFEVIAAARNGQVIPVLRDGRFPQTALSKWGAVRDMSIVSEQGVTKAFSCGSVLGGDSRHQFSNEFGDFDTRAVVLADGRLWIGPDMCRLAVTEHRITGLIVRRTTQDLLIYPGSLSTIPMAAQTAKAFQAELLRFEKEIDSGLFKEDAAINIPGLFPEDAALADDREISVKDILFRAGKLVVVLKSSNSQEDIELTLTPENKVERAIRTPPRSAKHLPPWLSR